jgi:hypothetical protein
VRDDGKSAAAAGFRGKRHRAFQLMTPRGWKSLDFRRQGPVPRPLGANQGGIQGQWKG